MSRIDNSLRGKTCLLGGLNCTRIQMERNGRVGGLFLTIGQILGTVLVPGSERRARM